MFVDSLSILCSIVLLERGMVFILFFVLEFKIFEYIFIKYGLINFLAMENGFLLVVIWRVIK